MYMHVAAHEEAMQMELILTFFVSLHAPLQQTQSITSLDALIK